MNVCQKNESISKDFPPVQCSCIVPWVPGTRRMIRTLLNHQYSSTQRKTLPLRFSPTYPLMLLLLDLEWHPDDSSMFTDDLGSCITTFPDPLVPPPSWGTWIALWVITQYWALQLPTLSTQAALLFSQPTHLHGPGFYPRASPPPCFQTSSQSQWWVMKLI